jgi:demethylmenaquinone methyltransferase/2-methoxy-6-polyprenyl-1,4-benzoquinol methylase
VSGGEDTSGGPERERPRPARGVDAGRCAEFGAGLGASARGGIDAFPEPGKVRQMFDGVAGSYDRLNDLMTAGLHHRWRELGVMLAQVGPGSTALDVCCGTGDFAFALRRAIGPGGRVVGVDVSEEMLDVAREKCGRNQLYAEFRTGDVLDLPFPDGGAPARGFDVCTVGFGIDRKSTRLNSSH